MRRPTKLTTTPTDSEVLMNTNLHSIVEWLVRESRRHKNRDEFVSFLVSQMSSPSFPAGDLEYTVGALRVAIGEYLQSRTGKSAELRCHFCGRSQTVVSTLVASAESAICDECVLTAFETVTQRQRHFHLRIAYFVFRFVASLCYRLMSPLHNLIDRIRKKK